MRLLAIVPVIAVLAACGGPAAATPTAGAKPARPPVPVVTAVARTADVPLRATAIGNASASELVTLRPQVTATIARIAFTEGDTVAAGAVLFALDDRAFAAAERQATAERDRARAQLALAEADAARTDDLVAQHLASTQQGDQSRATLASARAALASAEAALEKARLDLSWCTVTAPIAGRTGAVGMTVGNLAASGQTALVTIARLQPMRVGFSLPAALLPAVRAALAHGPVAVEAVPDGGGPAASGVLDLIDNAIDAQTATIRLRATFPNDDQRLWPGQQCRVDVVLGVDKGVVTVPEQAVQVGQRGSIVWVVGNDQTASPQPVKVARTVAGTSLITAGVAAGDIVVCDGQLRLTKGATVSPTELGAKPAAPADGRPAHGGGAAGK